MRTLIKYFSYDLTDCNALKEYLEKKSLQGWTLVTIDKLLLFEKSKAERVTYNVEMIFNTDIELYKKAGWEYVGSIKDIGVFKTNDQNLKPIKVNQKKKYSYIAKRANPLVYLIMAIVAFFLYMIIELNRHDHLEEVILFYFVFFEYILFTLLGIQVFDSFIWRTKAKKSLVKTGNVTYFDSIHLIKKNLFAFILLMVPFTLLLEFFQSTYVLTAIVIILILFIAMLNLNLDYRGISFLLLYLNTFLTFVLLNTSSRYCL